MGVPIYSRSPEEGQTSTYREVHHEAARSIFQQLPALSPQV